MEITPLHNWIAAKIGVTGSGFTREQLEKYQLRKLQETIDLTRNRSLYYRKTLAGWQGKDITNLADLKWLPFTNPETIRNNPLQFLCVSQDQVTRVVTLQSSGTTGEPKRLYFTKEDQELTVDFFNIGMSTLVSPGDKVLILLPGELSGSVGDLLAKGLERIGVKGIPHGLVKEPERTLEVMIRKKVDSLVGIPTQVLSLARYQGERGKTEQIKLKSVLLSTDYVPLAITRELQHRWGCRIFNHYGMTEMGLGGGVECQALAGYHLREADLYFEIINPKTGEAVPEGEVGEVVFTTLTRKGMPLIRYRTGDKARFIPQPCPCGTVLKRMERVTGRINGAVQLAGGMLTMQDLDEVLFLVEGLLNFEASISAQLGIDHLTIGVKMIGETGAEVHNSICLALEKIPLIKRAKEQKKLTVTTELLPENTQKSGASKRVIEDLRG